MELLRHEIPLLYAICNTLWEVITTCISSAIILAVICFIVYAFKRTATYGG